jgi:beta-glucosidase
MVGKEIVQLYVRDIESTVSRPEKELKGFEKVTLEAGEEKTISFALNKRAFAYYNVQLKDWHVESGVFEILIGKSSREIVLKETVNVESTVAIKKIFTKNSTFGELMAHPVGAEIMKAMSASAPHQDSSESAALGAGAQEMFMGTPMRNAVAMSNGMFTEEMMLAILQQVNQ